MSLWLQGVFSVAHAAPDWPELETAANIKAVRDASGDAAVIVAIEQYEALPAVPGARANAAAWFHYLVESVGVRRERVSALADSDAEDYSIRHALEARAAEVKKGGRLWFVFIGHGAPAELNAARVSDGWLVGYSAKATVEGIAARSVHRSEALKLLASSAAESVAILDACFSGTTPSGAQLVPGLQPLSVIGGAEPSGVLLLTAAGSGEFAGPLPGAARPAFSYLLLGALRGWGDTNRDGNVSGDEAIAYVRDALATVLQGTRSQRPTITGTQRSATLGHGCEQGPALLRANPFATPKGNAAARQTVGAAASSQEVAVPRPLDGAPVPARPYPVPTRLPQYSAHASEETSNMGSQPRPTFQLPPRPVWHGRTIGD